MTSKEYQSRYSIYLIYFFDSLFLGICDTAEVDQLLNGTQEQPHLLLRFNHVISHHWNINVVVHFIIHDGKDKIYNIFTLIFPISYLQGIYIKLVLI